MPTPTGKDVHTPINKLPKSVLASMRQKLLTEPNTLNASEKAIATRVCVCMICGSVWLGRKKRRPLRCEHCHRTGWDMPLLAQLLANEAAATPQPGAPAAPQPTEGDPA